MKKQRRVAIALEIDLPYPHHQDIFLGIQQFAREHRHWQCVIDEHPCYATHRRASTGEYDGVIARANKAMQDRVDRAGVPLVNVVSSFHRPGVAGVYPDTPMHGQQAAEHLIDRGFSRLLALCADAYPQPLEAARAFASTAERAGVACEVVSINEGPYYDGPGWVRFEKDILNILKGVQPPTGLFITNAGAARLVVQHAPTFGLHVPQDLAVICQYNIDSILNVPPQITSIDMGYPQTGYEAAALLERLMDGKPVPEKPTRLPPRGVIARETTDYFAVQDELVAAALKLISSNLHEKLRVDDIAYELDVSTRLLQMRFSEALGVGLSDEIRRLRLEKAKRLLAEPDRLIGSIPAKVGFATLYVMNQVFHRELGMSPSAYRKSLMG